ncbi:MAG: hypothetical protein WAM66_05560 [Acidobacteriaceae bacterium]
MGGIAIPDALHICPGCEEELASGGVFCLRCHEVATAQANYHAARAGALYSALARETGKMPESPSKWRGAAVWASVLLGGAAFWVLVISDVWLLLHR